MVRPACGWMHDAQGLRGRREVWRFKHTQTSQPIAHNPPTKRSTPLTELLLTRLTLVLKLEASLAPRYARPRSDSTSRRRAQPRFCPLWIRLLHPTRSIWKSRGALSVCWLCMHVGYVSEGKARGKRAHHPTQPPPTSATDRNPPTFACFDGLPEGRPACPYVCVGTPQAN